MRVAHKTVWIFLFLFLFLLLLETPVKSFAGEYDGGQIILSWSADNRHTQTITWHSNVGKEGYIRYRKSEAPEAKTQQIKAEITDVCNTGYYRYEAVLKGLSQNTSYDYRIGDGEAWSRTRTFTTAPNPEETEEGSFEFLYLGDVQYRNRNRDYPEWGRTLENIRARHPGITFALIGGDMVNSSRKMRDWNLFLTNAASVFSYIPMMPAIGNHETSIKADPFLQMLALPENGPQDLEEEFYSFNYGNCHFVVLNTCFLLENRKAAMEDEWDLKLREIKSWLKEDLVQSGAKWKIAVLHHPPYGISDGDPVYDLIRQEWEPALEQAGVDLALCGHQHIYMRTREIGGITYIIGNSGKRRSSYYNGENAPVYAEALDATNSNYQIIRVSGDQISLASYDEEGQIIDRWSKGKSGNELLRGLAVGLILIPVLASAVVCSIRKRRARPLDKKRKHSE